LEHILVEEEQGGKGLVLGARSHPTLQGQMAQKTLHLLFGEQVRVQAGTEVIVASNPSAIDVLGAVGHVQHANPGTDVFNDLSLGFHVERPLSHH
jgi:hypothetical protein